MEQMSYLSGGNALPIDNQQEDKERVKEINKLFMNEEVSLDQLAEVIYNSYLRKYPEMINTLSEGINQAA